MRLYEAPLGLPDQVPQHQAAKYENNAGRYWDLFYKRNAGRFFKDRHYFDREFPQITRGAITVLEVGCGAGNSAFPLLELNPAARVYACDFSPRAVELVRAHPAYAAAAGRVSAFVADITDHEGPGALARHLPARCVDFCSMVFVLSAVAPQHMRQALRNVASVLKPGTGCVLFRDYAAGDLAQARLEGSRDAKHIRGSFYARGDGTCCYYFDEAELAALFASEGFVCERSTVHARVIENRKSGVKMPRRWLQAEFRLDPDLAQQQQAQQQAEQQPAAAQAQQQGSSSSSAAAAGCSGSSSGSSGEAATSSSAGGGGLDGVGGCVCAGRAWRLPQRLLGGGGAGAVASRAQQLAALVAQGRVPLLGACVLLLPPWLRLAQAAPTGTAGTDAQQQQLLLLLSPAQLVMGCCSSSSCSCPPMHHQAGQRCVGEAQQGAAAALLSLVAVLLGARCVHACLPGAPPDPGQQQQLLLDAGGGDAAPAEQQQQPPGGGCGAAPAAPYDAAFGAVLRLNECGVVAERVRARRWPRSSGKHAAALQRELRRALSPDAAVPCRGLLVLAQQAPSAGRDSCCCSGCGRISSLEVGADAIAAALARVWEAAPAAARWLLLAPAAV